MDASADGVQERQSESVVERQKETLALAYATPFGQRWPAELMIFMGLGTVVCSKLQQILL